MLNYKSVHTDTNARGQISEDSLTCRMLEPGKQFLLTTCTTPAVVLLMLFRVIKKVGRIIDLKGKV